MMDHHNRNQRLFELFNKAMKGVIIITCLAGITGVIWLCTSGRARAMQESVPAESFAKTEMTAAVPEETILPETEAATLPETEAVTFLETEAVAFPETEAVAADETEEPDAVPETETGDVTITARAVPAIPYGYEEKQSGSEEHDPYGFNSRSGLYEERSQQETDHGRTYYYYHSRPDRYRSEWPYGETYGQSHSSSRIYYFWWF